MNHSKMPSTVDTQQHLIIIPIRIYFYVTTYYAHNGVNWIVEPNNPIRNMEVWLDEFIKIAHLITDETGSVHVQRDAVECKQTVSQFIHSDMCQHTHCTYHIGNPSDVQTFG
eukprot:131838_1